MKYSIEIHNTWHFHDTEDKCFKHVEDMAINECKNITAYDHKEVRIPYTYRYDDVLIKQTCVCECYKDGYPIHHEKRE